MESKAGFFSFLIWVAKKRKKTSRSTNVDADSLTYRVIFEARSKWWKETPWKLRGPETPGMSPRQIS